MANSKEYCVVLCCDGWNVVKTMRIVLASVQTQNQMRLQRQNNLAKIKKVNLLFTVKMARFNTQITMGMIQIRLKIK